MLGPPITQPFTMLGTQPTFIISCDHSILVQVTIYRSLYEQGTIYRNLYDNRKLYENTDPECLVCICDDESSTAVKSQKAVSVYFTSEQILALQSRVIMVMIAGLNSLLFCHRPSNSLPLMHIIT